MTTYLLTKIHYTATFLETLTLSLNTFTAIYVFKLLTYLMLNVLKQ